MPESPIHEEHFPEDHTPAELDLLPQSEEGPVETRGLGWIFAPALIGLVLGVIIGIAQATMRGPRQGGVAVREPLLTGAVSGAVVGLIAGGVFGLFVWVVFPYKGRNPHAPPPEPTEAAPPPPARDDYGVQG